MEGGVLPLEPQDIDPKLHCPVTEAPEEVRLASVTQGVRRWRTELCDSLDKVVIEYPALLLLSSVTSKTLAVSKPQFPLV